jgi:hypothetical protein
MTAVITWDTVLDTAIIERDTLELFTTSQQNLILNQVNLQIQESFFYDFTFDARRYLAAHLAIIAVGPAAGEGTVSQQSIGSISIGTTMPVNNPTPDQTTLSTAYGREYNEIYKQVSIPVWTD